MSHDTPSAMLWKFLLLLLLVPVLASLAMNTLLELLARGGVVTIVMIFIGLILCLQFRSNAARLAVGFFLFCWLANAQWPTLHGSVWLYLAIGLVVVAAYVIRELRVDHKPSAVKLHGIERKPVMPAAGEEHE
jgi:hypothetical protein